MRYLLILALIAVSAGCRSPQIILRDQPRQASTATAISSKTSFDSPDLTSSIEGLVETSLLNNPKLKESCLRIQALEHRIPQVASLPDPSVNSNTFLSPVETAAGRQAFSLGISQKFVDINKRTTRAENREPGCPGRSCRTRTVEERNC